MFTGGSTKSDNSEETVFSDCKFVYQICACSLVVMMVELKDLCIKTFLN